MGSISPKRLRKGYTLTPHRKDNDPFSRLTDDIIGVHILSRLPSKEAVRTSILSHRWKNLWTYNICPKLVFSFSRDSYFKSYVIRKEKILKLRRLLACGVSQLLEAYRKPRIHELTIQFDFDSSSSHDIDSWVEFALRKGVARLELDLSPWKTPTVSRICYPFLSMKELSALHALCDNHLHEPVRCAGMYNLRDVCLKYVNVSSKVIQLILCECPALEHLCVWSSWLLKKVKVTEKSVKLRSLEFVDCPFINLKISSSSLVSLKYIGYEALRLKHAPLLFELSIGREYCRTFLRTGSQNFGYISQLKKLILNIGVEALSESITYSLVFPKLAKLWQLEITMQAYDDSCLLWPIMLTKAAPMLHKLSVKVLLLGEKEYHKIPHQDVFRKKLRVASKKLRHHCLTVIEMHNFAGDRRVLKLAKRLLGISPSLEQFVVAPRLPGGRTNPHPRDARCLDLIKYRKCAKQLTEWLPPGAKLVVL